MMVKTGGPGGGAGLGGQGGKAGQQGQSGGGGDGGHRNTRLFFDGEESCYIIDAKLEGNLGRYLNVRTRSVQEMSSWGSTRLYSSNNLPRLCVLTAQLQSQPLRAERVCGHA